MMKITKLDTYKIENVIIDFPESGFAKKHIGDILRTSIKEEEIDNIKKMLISTREDGYFDLEGEFFVRGTGATDKNKVDIALLDKNNKNIINVSGNPISITIDKNDKKHERHGNPKTSKVLDIIYKYICRKVAAEIKKENKLSS